MGLSIRLRDHFSRIQLSNKVYEEPLKTNVLPLPQPLFSAVVLMCLSAYFGHGTCELSDMGVAAEALNAVRAVRFASVRAAVNVICIQ